ncbi:AtzE family amidohydrolase [Thiomonas intermedia]|uniref:AtzE family amidohydrolase n=1 Tax=Thiomonas intermedia TaxID=926 RepID=UPI0009A4DB78|nr:AtzE family amidohydrolase [Thiomonas intermedia]
MSGPSAPSCVPPFGDPSLRSALDMAGAIASGTLGAAELTQHALDRIALVNPRLNAFTSVTADRARRKARDIDAARARGEPLPPLAGVPYAVKNLFDVAGLTTLAGSRVLASAPAASADAVLVDRMERAGAVLVGALNMDEFAYGFTTENTHAGPTRNPHALSHSAGGSSGGCGAAVAAGLVPLSLGSDTNGSIRVPSSVCGIFGLKPTFGRLPRQGSYPFVYSLDHLGPFARSADDLARCFAVLLGDAAPAAGLLGEAGPLRAALLGGYFQQFAGPQARAAARAAAIALGAADEVEFTSAAAARAAAFIITASEGGQLHLDHLRDHYDAMEPLSRDRLAAGALLPASAYIRAQRVRALARAEARRLFERFDLLIAPATPVAAQPLGSESFDLNGTSVPTRPNMGLLTQPISCIGLPVVAAPMRVAPGELPIGVQLIAAPGREEVALRAARMLEAAGATAAGGAA